MESLKIVSLLFVFILQILIPAFFVYWTGFRRSKSKIHLLCKLLTVWPFFIYIFYAGQWSFIPYFLRYFFLFALTAGTLKSVMQSKTLAWLEKKNFWGWSKFVGQYTPFPERTQVK